MLLEVEEEEELRKVHEREREMEDVGWLVW